MKNSRRTQTAKHHGACIPAQFQAKLDPGRRAPPTHVLESFNRWWATNAVGAGHQGPL